MMPRRIGRVPGQRATGCALGGDKHVAQSRRAGGSRSTRTLHGLTSRIERSPKALASRASSWMNKRVATGDGQHRGGEGGRRRPAAECGEQSSVPASSRPARRRSLDRAPRCGRREPSVDRVVGRDLMWRKPTRSRTGRSAQCRTRWASRSSDGRSAQCRSSTTIRRDGGRTARRTGRATASKTASWRSDPIRSPRRELTAGSVPGRRTAMSSRLSAMTRRCRRTGQ